MRVALLKKIRARLAEPPLIRTRIRHVSMQLTGIFFKQRVSATVCVRLLPVLEKALSATLTKTKLSMTKESLSLYATPCRLQIQRLNKKSGNIQRPRWEQNDNTVQDRCSYTHARLLIFSNRGRCYTTNSMQNSIQLRIALLCYLGE